MWIRSQDRTDLVEVKNAVVIRSGSNGSSIDVNNYFVARYKTEERALEVLYEIQNAICESEVWVRQRNIQGFENSYNKYKTIFEMPKE